MSLSAEVNIFYNEWKDVVVVSVFRLGITGNVIFVLGFSFNRPMGLGVFFISDHVIFPMNLLFCPNSFKKYSFIHKHETI